MLHQVGWQVYFRHWEKLTKNYRRLLTCCNKEVSFCARVYPRDFSGINLQKASERWGVERGKGTENIVLSYMGT